MKEAGHLGILWRQVQRNLRKRAHEYQIGRRQVADRERILKSRHNETLYCAMMIAWASRQVRDKRSSHTVPQRRHESREPPIGMCSLFCASEIANVRQGRKVLPRGTRIAGRGRSGIFACKVKKITALPSSFAAGMEVKNEKWM